MQKKQNRIVLASTSPFRRELLNKLRVSFAVDSPNIDESPQPGESPESLVMRLAEAKAKAVGARHADALIIGSDQVAVCRDEVLGKPGSKERAVFQLSNASGQAVVFYTGLCLYNTSTGDVQLHCEPFTVQFRSLTQEQISRYLDAEEPYNCAGSFKSEGLGISLFEALRGNDPNSLIGLPLIQLIKMLEHEGELIP